MKKTIGEYRQIGGTKKERRIVGRDKPALPAPVPQAQVSPLEGAAGSSRMMIASEALY